CHIGRKVTHEIMRAVLLPLVQFTLDDNRACLDYLTRQWEEFRAIGAPYPGRDLEPQDHCVTVDLMYLPVAGRQVVDDFQSRPELEISSSGGAVAHSAGLDASLREGRLDDDNPSFTS